MKSFIQFLLFSMSTLMSAFIAHARPKPSGKTAYDFSFESLDGEPMPLSNYKGKVLLVVNTASKCGFTPQYKGLEALYRKYKDKGLVVIGVPSNDFGAQEPGSAQEIVAFCKGNYGVTFPMTAKQVVSGKDAHPFYRWAHEVLGFNSAPKWNFHKYLIDRRGYLIDYFPSTATPNSDKITFAIENLLAQQS